MYKSDERAHDRKMVEGLVREEEGEMETKQKKEGLPEIIEFGDLKLKEKSADLLEALKKSNIDEAKTQIKALRDVLDKIEQNLNRVVFEKEKKEGAVIDSTARFDQALEAGCLKEAEEWFEKAKKMEKYNDKWIDHQERKLFQAYYEMKDWVNAKRIVEGSVWASSKEGRKRRLEELSGMQYEEINSSE